MKPKDNAVEKGSRLISSWMGVFKTAAHVEIANSDEEIRSLVVEGYKVIGKLHSYNEVAIGPRVFHLGQQYRSMTYSRADKTATIGAAATIDDVMKFLLRYGRRLLNSGNFRQQTLVGAAATGTHGFGHTATIADAVVDKTMVGDVITSIKIRTAPLTQYEVTHGVRRLSTLKNQSAYARAFAVLPYGTNSIGDPICITTEYVETDGEQPTPPAKTWPLSWWRLRAFWCVDRALPFLRRWAQGAFNFVKIPPRTIYTSPRDIDALYHPWSTLDGGAAPVFALWAFKPTYTCYNIALFCKPEETEAVIRFAIREGAKLDRNLFRCFIGVRELTDKSDVPFAGNFDGPCNAIDFYCTPSKAAKLIQVQRLIQKNFQTRPHLGKTVSFERGK